MLLHCQICIFISGHSKFAMDWNLFFFCKITFTLNCWLLCLSGCEIYNVQYCKSKNIGNTRKIKEKLKILMTCDDFYFVNTTQKTSKPFKKNVFNSQDGWEKTSYAGMSAEGYWQKHEMQVTSKKVYWKSSSVQTLVIYLHWKIYFFRT